MDSYEVRLYFSPNDDCYVAQIVEFVGCAVDGPTPEIALSRLQAAKDDWIALVQKSGHAVPPPRYPRPRTVPSDAEELVTAP